jgi:hypothetical protein
MAPGTDALMARGIASSAVARSSAELAASASSAGSAVANVAKNRDRAQ